MARPQTYVNNILDGDGKPYRYRRWVYPTLHWLMRHPEGAKQPGLFMHIWIHIAMLLGTLVFLLVFVSEIRGTLQSPGTGPAQWALFIALPAMLVFLCYLHARWMRRFAIAIDLKARICPACGYPLTLQDNDDSLTDAICTECGRRWTSPPNS